MLRKDVIVGVVDACDTGHNCAVVCRWHVFEDWLQVGFEYVLAAV